MNRSIVSTRYARALLKYVRETGNGEAVCSEAEKLVRLLDEVPDLRTMLSAANDVVPPQEKAKLFRSALGGEMSPEMENFAALLNKGGRMEMTQDIMRDFAYMYHRTKGVRKAKLITAAEPTDKLIQSLKALIKQRTGDEIMIDVTVDPSIVGGFVFDLDDLLLDASVKHQLDRIREQFIERNRRIV